jgi:D-glycero-alpha-D-manno-heptose-7-phosphate kinase
MILVRVPLRVSFFGGGTDFPEFYAGSGGAVLSTTIQQFIYIMVNRAFDDGIRLSYHDIESVRDVGDIKHDLFREALRQVGIERGIEISTTADVPSRGTGLGSSSALLVGLLNALYAFKGKRVGPAELAAQACEIEIDRCRRPIGKQDQYIAAHGGLNFTRFATDGHVEVEPVTLGQESRSQLEKCLLIFYTGIGRHPNELLATQRQRMRDERQVQQSLVRMRDMAVAGRRLLEGGDLEGFGKLLHASWMEKRSLAPAITTPVIDELYEKARTQGALGGKILGAGGGGFLLLYVPVERRAAVVESCTGLQELDFELEPRGSEVVFNDSSSASRIG